MKIQVVQEGRFLRENLGSGRTKNLRQEPFHDFVGVCWKLGSFYPKKHRLRANVRICAEQSLGGWSSSWLWKCGIPNTPRECLGFFSGRRDSQPWRLVDVVPSCSLFFHVFSIIFPKAPRFSHGFLNVFSPTPSPETRRWTVDTWGEPTWAPRSTTTGPAHGALAEYAAY